MKIVHIIASIDPNKGGLQAVAMRIAAAQAGLGLEVHVVSYGNAEVERQVHVIGETIPDFSRIHWHLLPEPGRLERLLCFAGKRLVRQVLRDAAFMHIHGVWEPFLVHASKLARSAGIPYCICPAGMLDHWSLGQKSLKKKIALRLCYGRMLNDAAYLHILNHDEAAALTPLELKARTQIIPNGVFIEEFATLPQAGAFKQKMSLPADRRYILFLSRLHFKKGTDILASAFAAICDRHSDVDLVVAGPDDGAAGDFMSRIERLGIKQRVHMIGPIHGPAKIEAMVDAACFCLPSRQEGFSMAITEALACGTPVVITDQCHFPEVGGADAGLIVRVDPDEVASALSQMLESTDRAQSMGRNGRRLIMENYTWPAIAGATIRGYRLSA